MSMGVFATPIVLGEALSCTRAGSSGQGSRTIRSGPPSTRCERLRPTVRSHWSARLGKRGAGASSGLCSSSTVLPSQRPRPRGGMLIRANRLQAGCHTWIVRAHAAFDAH